MNSNQEEGSHSSNSFKQSLQQFWSTTGTTSKFIIYIICGCQLISLFYDRLYYCFSNIPYFEVYKYYEFYRLFTSLFVESLSFSVIFSIPMFIYTISRMELKDGPILVVYRIIMTSILSNIIFTLLSTPFILSKPDQFYSLSMEGSSCLWTVFFSLNLISDPLFRERILSNRLLLIFSLFFLFTSLLSITSISTILLVALCYCIPGLYSPSRRVSQLIIPFPLFRWLVKEEMKRTVIVEGKKQNVNQHVPHIVTLNQFTEDSAQYETAEMHVEPKQEEKSSRFKGKGHKLGM